MKARAVDGLTQTAQASKSKHAIKGSLTYERCHQRFRGTGIVISLVIGVTERSAWGKQGCVVTNVL